MAVQPCMEWIPIFKKSGGRVILVLMYLDIGVSQGNWTQIPVLVFLWNLDKSGKLGFDITNHGHRYTESNPKCIITRTGNNHKWAQTTTKKHKPPASNHKSPANNNKLPANYKLPVNYHKQPTNDHKQPHLHIKPKSWHFVSSFCTW